MAQNQKPLQEMTADEAYKFILEDPSAHNWLKVSLWKGWQLDPVDAANDAEIMAMVLRKRCNGLLDHVIGIGGATRYDYENQAWVVAGRYDTCGHPPSMNCQCYGKIHAGELAPLPDPTDTELRGGPSA